MRQRRKQDVRLLLNTIGKLGMGQRNAKAASKIDDEFDGFLDCMEADANAVIAVPSAAQGQVVASHHVHDFLEIREPDGHFEREDHQVLLNTLRRNRMQALSRREGT